MYTNIFYDAVGCLKQPSTKGVLKFEVQASKQAVDSRQVGRLAVFWFQENGVNTLHRLKRAAWRVCLHLFSVCI